MLVASIVSWPTAVVGAAFFLGLFWFLGRASSAPHVSHVAGSAPFKQTQEALAEIRGEITELRATLEEVHRLLRSVD